MFYPFRRWFVQAIFYWIGYFMVWLPGISAFGMPLLGIAAIADFLDWQGWEQMGFTLSIPFSGVDPYAHEIHYGAYTPYVAP